MPFPVMEAQSSPHGKGTCVSCCPAPLRDVWHAVGHSRRFMSAVGSARRLQEPGVTSAAATDGVGHTAALGKPQVL